MKKILVALLALNSMAAMAAQTWVGSADYTAAAGESAGDEDVVGPFSRYDFVPGVVLSAPMGGPSSTTPGEAFTQTYHGWYQSYVGSHTTAGLGVVAAPNLDGTVDGGAGATGTYELTASADFVYRVDGIVGNSSATITVESGSFDLWLDTTPDKTFVGDSGFLNGKSILSGSLSGVGGAASLSGLQIGGLSVDLLIGAGHFDAGVYDPATIAAGNGIFTLRAGLAGDAAFLDPITSVQGNAYASGTDTKFFADGDLVLAVPEPREWLMLLSGMLMVGSVARRRRR